MRSASRFPFYMLLFILQACGGGNGDSGPPPGDDSVPLYSRIWTYSTADPITSAPAIGDDGTIYFVTDFRELHAVNPDGSEQWVFAPGSGRLGGPPAINSAGNLILAGNGLMYSVSPYGTVLWEQSNCAGTRAIRADDAIVALDYDGDLFSVCIVNPDGTLQQRIEIELPYPHEVVSPRSITIAENGDMVVPFWDPDATWEITGIVSIAPDGTKVFNAPGYVGPAVGADGTLYVGRTETLYQFDLPSPGGLWAYLPDGTVAWNVSEPGGQVLASPVIGIDNTIYFSILDPRNRNEGRLYAVSEGGAVRWSIEEPAPGTTGSDALAWGGALVGADGMLYAIRAGRLNAIRPDGTVEHTSSVDTYCSTDTSLLRRRCMETPMALSDDGVLYVISTTGLDAIQTNSSGLAASSWPKIAGGRTNAYRYGAP